MTTDRRTVDSYRIYVNPVYPHSFPDPFVFKYCGEYFAVSTGFDQLGGVFPMLRSRDLINWEYIGAAMQPLPDSPPYYWAPEVIYDNGKFYLYYSVGNETLMEIRLAVSDRPEGGYVDAGVRLTNEEFAIDPHVFIDDDGAKYLFYATDFLDHTHIGTGTVVDRLTDWRKAAGNPVPVTRAKYDWQIYDPARKEKGGVRWHTVEGPAVLKRNGRYFEMFSAGNWQNTTYGVSFASSERIASDEEWDQFSDGGKVLPILTTIPGKVTGPGHNSIVRGPNNRELFCVYHSWTDQGRVMAIDRLDFTGNRIIVHGATFSPQPAPFRPVIKGFEGWQRTGKWEDSNNGVKSVPGVNCEIGIVTESDCFLFEVSFLIDDSPGPAASTGFRLFHSDAVAFEFSLFAADRRISIELENRIENFELPEDFEAAANHLLRVEVNNSALNLGLDACAFKIDLQLAVGVDQISFFSTGVAVLFDGFALTPGFEDLFTARGEILRDGNWKQLPLKPEPEGQNAVSGLTKGRPMANFELAVNMDLNRRPEENRVPGLAFLDCDDKLIFRLLVGRDQNGIIISMIPGTETFRPSSEEIFEINQLRLVKIGGDVTAYFDTKEIGIAEIPDVAVRGAILGVDETSEVEMVRLTGLL